MQAGQSSPSGVIQQVQQIEVLPPILVLHLERFLYDAAADGIVKISKSIRLTPELEIPPGTAFFVIFPSFYSRLRIFRGSVCSEIMAPVSERSAESAHYKLCGVLYHHGGAAVSGHYTVDVLHQNRDSDGGESWLHIDDEAVTAVRHEDVFVDRDNERVDNRCVYMLFYCCAASIQT